MRSHVKGLFRCRCAESCRIEVTAHGTKMKRIGGGVSGVMVEAPEVTALQAHMGQRQ